MAKQIEKLTPDFVLNADKPGMYPDGLGLYLQVSKWNTKSWLFRYSRNYKLRSMGLGPCHTVTLSEARKRAKQARQQILDEIDPIDSKHRQRRSSLAASARMMTFDQCAKAYIEDKRPGWKNPKNAEQWTNTLETYANPFIGKLMVDQVDTALVIKVLRPIWVTKNETASRIRGRIESILAWAAVHGFRSGDNPATWRNHLDQLLAKPSKVKKVKHFAALPYLETGAFVEQLRKQGGVAALALEFTILTAARTNETIAAKWSEFDLDSKTWTLCADRMKPDKVHRVPLCSRAFAILMELKDLGGEYVFPGQKPKKPLSNMAMLSVLERMGRDDLTVHGFRSTFRDWAAEQTAYPHEMAEMALSHAIDSKTEAAYRRGDLLKKRIQMMQDWQEYCDTVIEKK